MSDVQPIDAPPTPATPMVGPMGGPGSEVLPRGRGCIGSVLSNGCGCLAFLVGSGLAVALFGAHLLSGWGARALERYIGQSIDGTVEVHGVELSWSRPQKASSILIRSPEGDQVVLASLRFPPLLDLIGEPRGERRFRIQIVDLKSRVRSDGTSDLGRTFRLTESTDETVTEALTARVASFLGGVEDDIEDSSLKVEVFIDQASIDNSASVGSDVEIEDFKLVARVNRLGAQIMPSNCELRLDGEDEIRTIEFDAQFGFGEDGRLRLTRARLDADPIPRGVLETLGIAPRSGREAPPRDPRRRADVYDVVSSRAVSSLGEFAANGASIDARFGHEKDDGDPLLSLAMDSDVGKLRFDAVLRDDALVPMPQADGRSALLMTFTPPLGAPASILRALVPESIEVHDETPGMEWVVESRSFRLPVDPETLSLASGSDEREPSDARRLASWLRRAEAEISIHNHARESSRLRFEPANGGDPRWDRLDWTHVLTELNLIGELGGTLQSSWRTVQAGNRLARLSMSLPGRELVPREVLGAQLDLQIPGMSLALLEACAEIPEELRLLLPRRLERLDIRGVPVRRFLRPEMPDRAVVGVDVWTQPELRFVGTFERGEYSVPAARFDLEMTDVVCESLLLRVLPWMVEIEPLSPGAEVTITLRDFAFRPGSNEFREEGEAVVEAPPLRVRLDPSLARRFKLEDPDGWIEWTPKPMELSLEPNVVRYRAVELPLGDDVEPSKVSGSYDREDRRLLLTGLVEARSLAVAPSDGDGLLPVPVNITGGPGRFSLAVDVDSLKGALEDILRRVRPGENEDH
ncbi:MAG: hypothetical protein AAF957_18675 [Planctomycetota bacterium]